MRILFIHTDSEFRSEYKVHEALAEYCQNPCLEPYFVVPRGTKLLDQQGGTIPMPRTFFKSNSPKFVKIFSTIFFLPVWLLYLFKVIRSVKPDVIYSSQHKIDILFASFISIVSRVPHVIHLHFVFGPWLGRFVSRIISRSNRLIAVSEFIRESARLYKIPHQSINTILNPLPMGVAALQCNQPRHSIRNEFNWAESSTIITCVGLIYPAKGQLELVKAFAEIADDFPEARLLFCGNASNDALDYKLEIFQLLEERGLDTKIAFAGFRNDVPNILDQSDIFCLPASLEAFGLVFLEAMSHGLPVVAYHSGGVPEIVINGVTGLLSYPDDQPALEKHLAQLLECPAYAKQLGNAGKARLDREFKGQVISERWLTVLEKFK